MAAERKLTGVIPLEFLLSAEVAEDTRQMLNVGGLSGESREHTVVSSIRTLMPWLTVNLGKTFLVKLVLAFTGALALGMLLCGCVNSPELQRLSHSAEPEGILWRWFNQETSRVLSGDLEDWSLMEPCWLTIDSSSFELKDTHDEKAFRSACERLEAVDQKYDEIELFRQWNETNIFLRPSWENFSSGRDATESGCCAHLAHLLMWEDFSNEIRDIRDTLRDDLVCGSGHEYFYDGRHQCRPRDSAPIISPTFDDAVAAVESFLHDSAKYRPTRCASQACEPEVLIEAERDERFILNVLSSGRFDPLENTYLGRGEWRVLLISSWPDSGNELIECFKVLNKPGKYQVLQWRSKDRVSKVTVDAGYPWVSHCGGFKRLGDDYWKSRGSLPIRRMSD